MFFKFNILGVSTGRVSTNMVIRSSSVRMRELTKQKKFHATTQHAILYDFMCVPVAIAITVNHKDNNYS